MKKKKYFEHMRNLHDKAVAKLANEPEMLGIEGLKAETLIYKQEFPHLKGGKKETGDLILLWKGADEKELEITVLEVTVGPRRSYKDYSYKLRWSYEYFRQNYAEWFRKIGQEFFHDYKIFVRTAFVNYGNQFLWEKPYILAKRGRIY